jgi:hypothetical protein
MLRHEYPVVYTILLARLDSNAPQISAGRYAPLNMHMFQQQAPSIWELYRTGHYGGCL